MVSGTELGREFLAGIAAGDWPRLAATIAPYGRFRAATPSEKNPFADHRGGPAAAAQIGRWFDGSQYSVVASGVEEMADRIHLWYRVRGCSELIWFEVEQHAFCEPGPEGFANIQLVCSGFRPTSRQDISHQPARVP